MNIDIKRHLKNSLFMSDSELFDFAKTCPHRYKVYEINKKNGGTRTIAHPSKELKYVQNVIVNVLKANLSIHRCAFAYVPNKNIKENALLHVKNPYILKMDFKDFFPSITPGLFFNECEKHNIHLSKEDEYLIANFLFWKKKRAHKLVLSIGAPSSPFISNFIMYSFDALINEYCVIHRIVYSRYADDLTFSTNTANYLSNLPLIVSKLLKELYGNSMEINLLKTSFSSKKHNRHITGITITNDGKLSLSRKKKRYIRHLIHKFMMKSIETNELQYLRGYFSFIQHIEPVFLSRLISKYSEETIRLIRSMEN